MTTPLNERIWATNYTTRIDLRATPEGLELTADVGDQETTVVLDLDGVKRLRLALLKYERQARSFGEAL